MKKIIYIFLVLMSMGGIQKGYASSDSLGMPYYEFDWDQREALLTRVKEEFKDNFFVKQRSFYSLMLFLRHPVGTGFTSDAQARFFINSEILKMNPSNRFGSNEEREQIFQAMKETGFLRTDIETTDKYHYSEAGAAYGILNNHPEIDTLVLGCGSGLPFFKQDTTSFGGEWHCKHCHSIANRELSVVKSDSQGGLGSAADVMGDVTQRYIWKGFESALGEERKFQKIVDHSLYPLVKNQICLENALKFLVSGGILEIVLRESQAEPRIDGFELESQNPWLAPDGNLILESGRSFNVWTFRKH